MQAQAEKRLSNAQKKKMKAAYKKILKQARRGTGSYGGVGLCSEYVLYDIGCDGIPELFIKTSDSSWGGSFHVFDYALGKARHLGICPLSDGWLYGTKKGKLYLSSGRQGAYGVSRVVKSNGHIVVKFGSSKSFVARSVNDWDEALNRCDAYVRKLGATALSTRNVGSYSLLNSKIKIKKAKVKLSKKAKSLAKSNCSVKYKFVDLDGNGVSEMFVQKHEAEAM